MKLSLLLIPLLFFMTSCSIDWSGSINITNEISRGIISLITTIIGIYIGFTLWKKQEKIKKNTESGINLLTALKDYEISIEQARPIGFLLTDTEENIRNKHWENVIKSWKNLTSAYAIACITISDLEKSVNLDGILEIQNELYANLSTYLQRKNNDKFKDDKSDSDISKIIIRNIDASSDEFAIRLNAEVDRITQVIKSSKNINF
ncbi:MAG: hypothetical protein HHAS10_00610 [Candidatus Altimarinota bacterium]